MSNVINLFVKLLHNVNVITNVITNRIYLFNYLPNFYILYIVYVSFIYYV